MRITNRRMISAASGIATINMNSTWSEVSLVWVEFAFAANASVVTVAKALVVSSSAVSSSVVLCPEYSDSSSFPKHEQKPDCHGD